MILCDSSVWIDWFNGIKNPQTDRLYSLLEREDILILDVILHEVLQGFKKDSEYEIALDLLSPLTCYQVLDKEAAIFSASHFRTLRKKGITIRKTIDVMIASWCIRNDVELLHNDHDFDMIATALALQVVTG